MISRAKLLLMSEEEVERYNHVMYYSKSHVHQFFTQNVSESDSVKISEYDEHGSKFEIGLDAIAKINTEFGEEVGREELHEINFNESFLQVKKAINILSESESVLPISELKEGNASPIGLYHFDCPLQLIPEDSDFDDKMYLEVIGMQNDVKFVGITSWENWSSRSHALSAIRGVDPYPFKGVVKPLQIEESNPEWITFSVQYLYIIAPDLEENKKWREYQHLLQEHPGQSPEEQGFEFPNDS